MPLIGPSGKVTHFHTQRRSDSVCVVTCIANCQFFVIVNSHDLIIGKLMQEKMAEMCYLLVPDKTFVVKTLYNCNSLLSCILLREMLDITCSCYSCSYEPLSHQ